MCDCACIDKGNTCMCMTLYRYLIIFILSKQEGTVYGKITEKEEGGKNRGRRKEELVVCACRSYCAV